MAQHRIQVRLEDEAWARAERAMQANGLVAVSKLCEVLLHREYVRIGIEEVPVATAVAQGGEDEHRIQVRVRERDWVAAQGLAATKGFATVSDLCRHLLLEEVVRDAKASKSKRAAGKGKGLRT